MKGLVQSRMILWMEGENRVAGFLQILLGGQLTRSLLA